jgi:hypothetical protein
VATSTTPSASDSRAAEQVPEAEPDAGSEHATDEGPETSTAEEEEPDREHFSDRLFAGLDDELEDDTLGNRRTRDRAPPPRSGGGVKQVDQFARQEGIQQREAFGDYLERVKDEEGIPHNQNFTWDELVELANEFRAHGGY